MKNGSILFLCVVAIISFYFTSKINKDLRGKSCSRTCHVNYCPYIQNESEGTKENPFLRSNYFWQLLSNPKTKVIPKNIHFKENEFVNMLRSKSSQRSNLLTEGWLCRGPYEIGGRTTAIAFDTRNDQIILAGSASGGMWKTTNQGTSWYKTTAANQLHSVSCLAQNKASGYTNIWYYGTGEGYPHSYGTSASGPILSNAFYLGDGIFKSIDNGETWNLLPATVSATDAVINQFDFIFKIITFDLNGVMAATSNGIMRSTNGGTTWTKVLGFSNYNITSDVDITSSGTYYATLGGDFQNSGIFTSSDGINWNNITPANWDNQTVRTVISPVPTNGNVVYFWSAKVSNFQTQLRKYQTGIGWSDLTQNLPDRGVIQTFQGKMMVLSVKPDDENVILLESQLPYISRDRGSTFNLSSEGYYGTHVDHFSISFSSLDPKIVADGNDGGVYITKDISAPLLPYSSERLKGGLDWQQLNNGYRTTQFYTVAIDHSNPNSKAIIGGTQDNGVLYSNSENINQPWQQLFGGDGGFTAIADGGLYKYAAISVSPTICSFWQEGGFDVWSVITPTDYKQEGTMVWMPPMILDKHDSKIMYLPWKDQLWRNNDLTSIPSSSFGSDVNWERLNNVNNTSEPPWQAYITAFGMSSATPRRLYYGSVNGDLFRLDNPHTGQPVPVRLNITGLPKSYVHCIAVDPNDVNILFVVYPNYEINSIYYSKDGGNSWTSVGGNLEENPDGSGNGPSIRWLSILYVNNQPVYLLGTSVGLFSSTDIDGNNTRWIQEASSEIGNLVIDMIEVRQSDKYVVVGTHGNGIYTTRLTQTPNYNLATLNCSTNPTNAGKIDFNRIYNVGQIVTLKAAPNNGFTFLNWTENGAVVSTDPIFTFTIFSNRNLVANFRASTNSITLSSNPSNGGSVAGAGTYDNGSTVTVTANPNSGFKFVNWTENGSIVSTNASFTLVLNNDRTLVANFEKIPHLTTNLDFISVTGEAGSGSFIVSNITGGTLSWTAVSNVSWITITQGSTGNIYGSSSQIIEFSYEANPGAARAGTITITSDGTIGSPKTFEVRQAVATDISDIGLPTTYQLFQNYPNPFNPSTIIHYQIPKATYVTLKVFDSLGKEIASLVNEYKSAGYYNSLFTAPNSSLSCGVYYYRLTAGDFSETKKCLLIK